MPDAPDPDPTADRRPRRAVVAMAIVAGLAVGTAAVASIYGLERARLRADRDRVEFGRGEIARTWRKIDLEAIARPPTRPAEEAGLDEAEEVIGVVVDGRARAYRLEALDDPRRHIINDMVGDRPVTVARCNVSDCTRAYAGDRGEPILDIAQGGLWDSGMVVKALGAYYQHRTGAPMAGNGEAPPFPFRDFPVTRTTWKLWKDQHPETDVYVGGSSSDRGIAPGRAPSVSE